MFAVGIKVEITQEYLDARRAIAGRIPLPDFESVGEVYEIKSITKGFFFVEDIDDSSRVRALRLDGGIERYLQIVE